MRDDRKKLGNWGEDLASSFLKKKGYKIIETNFRTRFGEIDIVCKKGDKIVFIEVKTRSGEMFGAPEESIDGRKRHKLEMTAYQYLRQKKLWHKPYAIDGIFIETGGGGHKIRHLENIIEADCRRY